MSESATVHRMPVRLSNGTLFTPTEEQIRTAQRMFGKGKPFYSNEYAAAKREVEATAQEVPALERIYTPAEMDTYVQDRIRSFVPTALDLITSVVSGALPCSIALRAKYAAYLLSCAGYGPITKVDSRSLNQHLTSDDVKTIKDRAEQAALDAGFIRKE